MTAHREALLAIYDLFVQRRQHRLPSLEKHIGHRCREGRPLIDDERNEPALYAALCGQEGQAYVVGLYESALTAMRGQHFADCSDALECLGFLQEVIATAMWRYGCKCAAVLDAFARDFDRLDLPQEQRRLHAMAQGIMPP